MKTKRFLHIALLLAIFFSIAPLEVKAFVAPPPADMFQLPWEQGQAWVSFDGFDNGTRRLPSSPHNYKMGGAVDFAPRVNMQIGQDTSNDWVTAAAAGRVIEISFCHLKLEHGNGWVTEYWHLDNIQVNLGQNVSRNQRLGIIHNNATQRVCVGNEHPGPHLHFVVRPKMQEFTFAGWVIGYSAGTNKTTFTKNGQTVNRLQPILNIPNLQIVSRGLLDWDTNENGTIDPYRYERWTLPLSEQTEFTVTLTTPTTGLVPVIVLLNDSGIEITRASGVLTTTQPAGTYYIQIQADAGTGFYDLIATRNGGSGGTPTASVTPTVDLTQTSPTPTVDLTQFPVTATSTIDLTQFPATATPTIDLTQFPATATPTIDLTQFPATATPTVDLTQFPATATPTIDLTQFPATATPTIDLTQFPATATPTIDLTQFPATATPTIDLTQFPATATPTIDLTQFPATATPTIDLTQFPATATPTIDLTQFPATATPTIDLTQFPVTATPTIDLTQFPATVTPIFVTPTVDLTQFPATSTATLVPLPSETPISTITSTPTLVLTPTNTAIPTPTGPYVLTDIIPSTILIDETTSVTVSLLNVPVSGYASAEITCTYNPVILEANNIAVGNVFGDDPASAVFGPQNGSFIVAIAGSNGNRATTNGIAFTFDLTGLSIGQSNVECTARVSSDGTLENISYIPDSLTVIDNLPSPTPTVIPDATVNGQVLAGKPVTIQLFDLSDNLIASSVADSNGNFSFTAPAGDYVILASAAGYLDAQGSISLVGGVTRTMQTVTLPAGDIDGNGVIDQFDALTIGMNYNLSAPSIADLNNDGIINVLDAELLADNYRLSGAVAWQ
jgi:murein DD-endopeptidase MepM/ murein hydrolase activator NlpD